MPDDRTEFERVLEAAAAQDAGGLGLHAGLLRRAAEKLAAYRRAVELSRVWWDDRDPYRAEWGHKGFPCDLSPCAACTARAAAMAVLAEG